MSFALEMKHSHEGQSVFLPISFVGHSNNEWFSPNVFDFIAHRPNLADGRGFPVTQLKAISHFPDGPRKGSISRGSHRTSRHGKSVQTRCRINMSRFAKPEKFHY
jgi:hypothetical protein